MKKLNRYLTATIFMTFISAAFAQKGYYLEQRIHSGGVMGHPAKDQIQKSWLSDNAIRVEGPKNITIFRFDKNMVWLLQPSKKEYMEVTMKQMQASAEMGMSMLKKDGQSEFTFKKTDEKKTINNWKCYKVISQSPTIKQTIWLTEDLPFGKDIYYKYFKHMPRMKELADLIYNNKEIEGFPVLTEIEMDMMGMQVKSSSELLKIKETDMKPSLFELPGDYKKITHPMMQMNKDMK